MGAKWDTKLKKPAYKHLNDEELRQVVELLKKYLADKTLLLKHDRESLLFRKNS
ncbi:hypothetical protein GCM10009117_08570 [Gangjinia marincola]|uniref:Uncharacterized protein n=1 Tax=Gangjinia marincola TaxID=578463 RepID=A0ABP3XR16_9FLAO